MCIGREAPEKPVSDATNRFGYHAQCAIADRVIPTKLTHSIKVDPQPMVRYGCIRLGALGRFRKNPDSAIADRVIPTKVTHSIKEDFSPYHHLYTDHCRKSEGKSQHPFVI